MSGIAFRLPKAGALRAGILDRLIGTLTGLSDRFEWEVRIVRATKQRTDDQNHALFGVAYKALRDQTGNDVDDLHTYFLGEYFGWVEHDVMGRSKLKPRRTTTTDEQGKRQVLNTVDFADFYDFIQRRAAEAGYIVPDPDPLWREHREAA